MIKKFLLASYVLITSGCTVAAQSITTAENKISSDNPRPKLVVGIVIDQMRWDYLYKYQDKYSANGFKRLLTQGYSFENTLIPYTPTYTAAGHACIYTGSVPAINGIIGNNWYDKHTDKNVYCTEDAAVITVGSNSIAGKMSPANLWTTTITDELRLSNQFQSKVIGISLKDRGAILPAGHSANAAYWYDETVGKFITSTYYMNALPQWVNNFNNKDLPTAYMAKDWNTLFPADQYILSTADNKNYEGTIGGEALPVFPHQTSVMKDKYASFKFTPSANTYSFDFAKASIENENLGAGNVTDFLALSLSTPDYIGHAFGPNSMEIEDVYYRLDRDMADFLQWLDTKLGKGNYLIFLTADHGVAHIPAFLKEYKIPGGTFSEYEMKKELNEMLEKKMGLSNIILSIQNYQLYLNEKAIDKNGKDLAEVKKLVFSALKAKPYIVNVFETELLTLAVLPEVQKRMMTNGYNAIRSGQIMFTVKPGYFDGGTKGTTHGLWNPYDAHIPNVWFGWNIKPGKSYRETYMTDIAPTVAALLKIQMPNGNVGTVLEEVLQ